MHPIIGRAIKLPEHGIYTEDGFLFHHVGSANLRAEHIERLHEFGTGYLQGVRFKPEEDEIIKKNWINYATANSVSLDSALELSGAGSLHQDIAAQNRRRQFCIDTNFWPEMCNGLPHRSGHQVKRRIWRIYDKAILEDPSTLRKKTGLPYADLKKFIRAYRDLGNIREAADKIKKPYELCRNAHDRFRNIPILQSSWLGFWNTVVNSSELPGEDNFHKSVKRAIRKQNKEELERLKAAIDFTNISHDITKKKDLCIAAWDEIVAKLTAKYLKCYEKYEHKKAAWAAARRKTFKASISGSVEKFSQFLRILVKSVDKKVTYVQLKKKYIRMDSLAEKMVKYSISGIDFDENESVMQEAERLVVPVQRLMKICEELIFRRLALKFKLHERLEIISRAFDRQLEKAGIEPPEIGQGEDKLTTEDLKNLDERLTYRGYVTLNREPMVETVVLFAKELDPDWIPPTVFKKYVEDEEVLKLFSKEKNNTALLSLKLLDDYNSYTIEKRKQKLAEKDGSGDEEPFAKRVKNQQVC